MASVTDVTIGAAATSIIAAADWKTIGAPVTIKNESDEIITVTISGADTFELDPGETCQVIAGQIVTGTAAGGAALLQLWQGIVPADESAAKASPVSSADAPTYVQLLGIMGVVNGNGIYKSPIHFTAVRQAATALDLSGHPAITDITQFLLVVQISNAGVVTWHYPSLSTGAFSWDSANSRLTVAAAVFAATDVFGVVIQAADRYSNQPGDFRKVGEVNPYELRGDDAGVPLITVAQDFTAAWADLGPEIALFGYSTMYLWLTVDINLSTDVQFRLLAKHESGGTEEYQQIIDTIGVTDVQFQSAYRELAVDADGLYLLPYALGGSIPYGQMQIKAGALGGTAAQIDAAYYTRGTFGG